MRRREFITVIGGGAMALPLAARAQQPRKVSRIAFLWSGSFAPFASNIAALRRGLYELGYVEGQNILIEYRFAEGQLDRLPALAAELAGLPVDIIVTVGDISIRAARQATSTIPIVVVRTS